MALVRQFYTQRKSDEDGVTYSLARDVTSDRVFVLHCRTHRVDGYVRDDETKLTLSDFLSRPGPAQSALLDLIGSLVIEA